MLVLFLGFYSCLGGQELETTITTKKNHQNSILRDSLKIVFSWFLQWVWCFFMVFVGFLGFYNGFGGQELETTVKTKKNHKTKMKHHQTIQTKHNFQTTSHNKVLKSFLVFTVVSVSSS